MELINISKISTQIKSVRESDPFLDSSLLKSVKQYGQLRPIVINQNYVIIDGHKLYDICLSLNMEQVWICIVPTENSEQTHLELNTIHPKINPISFYRSVRDHVDTSNNCIPFSKKHLEGFIKLLDFDWESFKNKTQNVSKSFF